MDDKELDKLFDMEGDDGEEKKLPADEPAVKEEKSGPKEDKEKEPDKDEEELKKLRKKERKALKHHA